MTKALFNLDLELLSARTYIERTEIMPGAICEEYFSLTSHNPDTPQGQSNILNGFDWTLTLLSAWLVTALIWIHTGSMGTT